MSPTRPWPAGTAPTRRLHGTLCFAWVQCYRHALNSRGVAPVVLTVRVYNESMACLPPACRFGSMQDGTTNLGPLLLAFQIMPREQWTTTSGPVSKLAGNIHVQLYV
jgi:hypothetical protein